MKNKGRPPTISLRRLDELLHYVGVGTEYTDRDEDFAAVFGISERQFQRVIALGKRLGKLDSRLFKVCLGQGWYNVRTVWVTVPLPYLGDGEWEKLVAAAGAVVEQVAAIAQQPVVPEVKVAEPVQIAEPVAEPEVAPAPVAQPPKVTRETPVPMPLSGPLREEIITYAVQKLRGDKQHLPQRE